MAGTGNKLDFGFGVFPYSYVSFAEMAELAKLGDALGYNAFALPEHLLAPCFVSPKYKPATVSVRSSLWFPLPPRWSGLDLNPRAPSGGRLKQPAKRFAAQRSAARFSPQV